MTARQANLLTALGLSVLLAVVTLTAPRWSRFLRQPLAGGREDDGPAAGTGDAAARTAEPEGERRTKSPPYFWAPGGGALAPEESSVPPAGDPSRPPLAWIAELVLGSP